MSISAGHQSDVHLSQEVKAESRNIIRKYAVRSNARALLQCCNTLVPYFTLFFLSMKAVEISYWLAAASTLLLSLFTLRVFILMHDCGHNSLFRTQKLNEIVGFLTGVLAGMPQYVWSQHHSFHHATNGNWQRYRGPLSILSCVEYEQLSSVKQKLYRYSKNILFAPAGAFMYFIFSPRFNWIAGSLKWVFAVSATKWKNPGTPLQSVMAEQKSAAWKTGKEYRHMALNNIVLLSSWYAASVYFGATTFFTVYLVSLSLAGAAGIIIFTIQHNFEDSYAAADDGWNYYVAALKGTSFLSLPKVMNWFSADIAYHHVHHLSAGIPNYNLASCHREYAHLFAGVKRIGFGDIAHAFRFILWDSKAGKIISVEQHLKRAGAT